MANAELITPTDEITGLPWLIVPPAHTLPAKNYELADDNHSFHPARSPELATPAGVALRACRVQRVDWWDHHIVYHGYFAGPELPKSDDAIFRTVVFAAAGYIPDMGINCNDFRPRYEPLSQEVRERLWRTGEVRVQRPGVIKKFLAAYLSQQDISHIDDTKIEEFLYTPDRDKQLFLGNWLLAQAAEVAVEPFGNVFRMARRKNQIAPQFSGKPETFVTTRFGEGMQRSAFVKVLHASLAEAV